jgi:hypothetical protein
MSTANDGWPTSIMVAHAACGALAAMIFIPLAIITPRIVRTFSSTHHWFPAHAAINGIISFGLVIAAYAISQSHGSAFGGPTGSHGGLATVFFILMIVQVILGIAVHWLPRKKIFGFFKGEGHRGVLNYVHWPLGVVIMAIGFGTVYTGKFWGCFSAYTPS